MTNNSCTQRVSRRALLQAGGSALAAAAIAGCSGGAANSLGGDPPGAGGGVALAAGTSLRTMTAGSYSGPSISPNIAAGIERIINAKGMISDGVLNIEIDRKDITDVRWHGYPILPSFQINGSLVFQCAGSPEEVMMNSDMALKTNEVQPFIDQLMHHEIVFQAEHQHVYDWEPDVWFIHFRMKRYANAVATAVKDALNATSTPFPQAPPAKPSTPLPAEEIGRIIGAKPSIGDNGVVNLEVPRANPIVLGGMHINPYLNVETPIGFQPVGGTMAIAVADYGMIASEIQNVVAYNRSRGWESGCLYNQETDEQPQLYFDHHIKVGDALTLAREIRGALDLMDMVFKTP